MPIVIVFGIPPATTGIKGLKLAIKNAVAGIPALDLKANEVTVYCAADLEELGEDDVEMVAFLRGLFGKRKRTNAVRQEAVNAVHDCLDAFASQHFDGDVLIEVLPDPPFQPRQGFRRSTVTGIRK